MDSSIQPSIQVQRIQAIGLTVTDIARSILFYTEALRFEVISDITLEERISVQAEELRPNRIRIATLKLGDEQIRLMQYLDEKGKPIPEDSHSNDLWFQHLAIVVSDMERAYSHLQSFPIEPISTSPQTIPPDNKEAAYIQAFKFRDPDLHPLELIWFPPDKGQQKWHQSSDQLFLGIDHTAIAISNTEQSLQFYRDFLGMHVDGGSFNSQETQARMDGLPDAKVRITALRPTQGGLGIELLDYIEPANGRPIPSDLKPYDTTYVQAELIVHKIEQANHPLYQNSIQFFPLDSVQLEDYSLLHHLSHRVKDPTGHALLLISKQD